MTKITIERETLLPCPFCGANAEILTIPEDHPDAGAMFVQCCDSRCMTSSALLYPLMDDVRALLVDRWNRRAALAAQPVALQPPIDNAFVAPDCEQFSSNQSDASRLLEILGVALDECRRLAAVPPAPAAVPPGINLMEGAKWRDLYHELLMAVAMKYPGETRHETALRLIKRAQDYGNGTDRAMIAAAGDKP